MRRRYLAIGLALAAIVAGAALSTRIAGKPARLNVLLITLDTTRADRLGCYGYAEAQTPAIDALARRGVVYERAYTAVPLTLPSHATMFTGLLPPEHGVRLNATFRLDDNIPRLAERLTSEGYRTGAFIGAFVLDRQFGLDRGFDVYDDRLDVDHAADRAATGDGHDHKERPGSEVVDDALRWLQDNTSEPFFCWVHLFDPHLPYLPHDDLFGSTFADRPYDGELAYVDRQVQRLVDHLQKTNNDEHTLIVVVGDHGESLGEHGEETHGYTIYNATLHVPLIVVHPQREANGARVVEPVSLVNLPSTLLDLLALPPGAMPTGESFAESVDRETPRTVYAETLQPEYEGGWSPQYALLTERWKYIRSPRVELYDLEHDPHESMNLAEQHPDRIEEFERQLASWESSMTTREAPAAPLTPDAQRTLAGLGYAGGGASQKQSSNAPRADIKDRIAYYNRYIDAVRRLNEGEIEAAADELRAIVAAVPDYFKAQYNLGVCQMRLGKYEDAAATFERAVAIDANATALVSLAKAYLAQGRAVDALPVLERAQELQPDSPEIRFLLQDARGKSRAGEQPTR